MAENRIRNEASSSRSSNSGGNSRGESVVTDVGRRRSSCGYCKSGEHTSISHGIWAHSLTVDDYQALLDRGWRRSGSFLYKPEMEKTCCPPYTIRLKASDFVPTKEQLRVSKRMQRFLDGTLDVKKTDEPMDGVDNSKGSCSLATNDITSSAVKGNREEKNKDEQFMNTLSDRINNAIRACIGSGEFPSYIELPKASVKKVVQSKRKLQVQGSEDLLYSSNIGFQIAAALRRADKDLHHLKPSRHSGEENDQSLELTPSTIADKLASSLDHLAESSGLSVRACNGHINFYSSTKQACSDEMADKVTVTKESCLNESSKRPCIKRQKLEIRLKRSSFDPEEYSLYRRYQMKVHNDSPDRVTESSYKRFLVDTPLVFVQSTGDCTVPACGFGSFHQQYVINGRVVAVGVIDILPKCLSSKYLFWDPDLDFLSLGKYSALQEISWVKENQTHCPNLQYYYLGYYIHSCSKMTYKAAYRPSELLCPLRHQWIQFDVARPLLDRKPYVVLSDFPALQNADSLASNLLENQTEVQHDVPGQEDSNDIPMEEDEDMAELDSEDSDDESDPENSGLTSAEIDDVVSNILIGLKGARLRYKFHVLNLGLIPKPLPIRGPDSAARFRICFQCVDEFNPYLEIQEIKDLREGIGPNERGYLETPMHRYVRVVGTELAERMVYSVR